MLPQHAQTFTKNVDNLIPLQALQPTEPAYRILKHCHSVMQERGKLLGDTLETAVLEDLGGISFHVRMVSCVHEDRHGIT